MRTHYLRDMPAESKGLQVPLQVPLFDLPAARA